MADPTIKIKIDYDEIPKGVKVIKSELDALDKAADDIAKKYLQLTYTFNTVGQRMLDLGKNISTASTKVTAANRNIRNTLNTTKAALADFNQNSMMRVNLDVENADDKMKTFSSNMSKTKTNIKKFNDQTDKSDERLENMATAMTKVNKQTLGLKKNSNKAAKDMRGLNNAIFNLTKGLEDQIKKLNEAGRKINNNVSKFDKLEKAMNKNTKAVNNHKDAYKKLSTNMNNTQTASISLGNILSGLITLQSISLVIQYADAWAKLTNNIRIFAKNEAELITIRSKLFDISQRTRTELTSQVTLYNRLKIAQKDLGISESGILKITESVGYALGVTSTSALEARGSLIQLGQALGSGIVRAEEFNSINEGTPKVMQAIAQAFNMTRSQLRTLVLDGKILSSDFSNALIVMSDNLKKEYGAVNQTIRQSFINIKSQLQRLVGEIGKSTGVYSDFVDSLKWLNKAMDENSNTIIRNSGVILDLIAALIGAGGLMLTFKILEKGIKALAVSFKTLNLAMKANLVILGLMATYDLYKLGTELYSRTWGEDARSLQVANDKLETEVMRKGKLLNNLAEKGVLEALRGTDTSTAIKNFKDQLDAIDKQISSIQGAAFVEGISVGLSDRQSAALSELKTRRQEINGLLNTTLQIKNAIQVVDDKAANTAKQQVSAREKELKQAEHDAKIRQGQQDFLKIHNKEIKSLTKKYNIIQSAKKKINDYSEHASKYTSEELKRYNDLLTLISEEETITKRLNTLREGAGKDAIDANQAAKTSVDILNERNKALDEEMSKLKSRLKDEVSEGTRAQKRIDSLKDKYKGNISVVKDLINTYQEFVDQGHESEETAKRLGIIITENYGPLEKAIAAEKSRTAELEKQATAQTNINRLKAKVKTQEALKLDLDSFFSKSGLAVDAEGLALYDRINQAILEAKGSMQKLKTAYGDKVDISILHNLTMKEEEKIYEQKRNYEKEMTDYVSAQGKTRYQAEVDSLRKTEDAMKKKYPEYTNLIATYTNAQIDAMHPMKEYINSMEDPIIAMENVFVNAFKGMEDSIVEFVKTGKFEWKDFTASIIEGMLKMEAQRLSTSLMSGLTSTDMWSSFAGLFTGSAKGNVFGAGGIQAFASGGAFTNSIVSQPTMFAHGGGFGVMGEAGDEAILPLSRTSKGNLGVEASVSQPNVILNVENNTGQDVSANQVSSQMIGKDLVLSIVMEAASNNGAFKRNIQGALSR